MTPLPARTLLAGALALTSAACLRRGPEPDPGPRPRAADGIVLFLPSEPGPALAAAAGVLAAQDYALAEAPGRRRLRTRPRRVAGDTALVVDVEVNGTELPNARSVVVLTATYSAPGGPRRARLYNVPATASLWVRLRALEDLLRAGTGAAPARTRPGGA